MIQIIIGAAVALIVSILLTPYLIKRFTADGLGQEIRLEGPQSHQSKRGTPTMGGLAILAGLWLGYLTAHAVGLLVGSGGPSASGLLVLLLTTSLGIVGFLDDYIKLKRARNLGLNAKAKFFGQLVTAMVFAVLALQFPNADGLTPASTNLSFVRDIDVVDIAAVGSVLGLLLFLAFAYFVITAWSNAVNITDGLDGLAAGATSLLLGAYVLITFWQFRYSCTVTQGPECYQVRDPLDLALVAAAAMGGCIGFLWWNAAPAKIFMGDTGSLALGGLVAGLSIATRTELLMVVIGALFVLEIASVVIQVGFFKVTGNRVFRMAPFHHHFELGGWAETTVIIRFWLLAAVATSLGVAVFYGEWLATSGVS